MKATKPFYKSCLEEELARRCEKNPRYSMKAMARAVGVNSASFSQYFSGKQVPSWKAANKMIEKLALGPHQRERFLSSLADTQQRRGLKKMSRAFRSARLLSAQPQDLSIDLFRVIADPIHYAILDSTFLEDFQPNTTWIASRLGISVTEAGLAVSRLLELGLLTQTRNGWIKAQDHITTADKHMTTPALRQHQRRVLDRAIEALENEPLERRSCNSLTLSANPRKISQAKALIEKFMGEIAALLNDGPQTEVYQVHLSLFPVTKSPNSGGSS